ncbi:MAG: thiol:disulfide interchange protein DsbA/DsbL [Betaproteobacteria bacterium]|nr:thiol:disulfide interchange protein DsbA/DsbL [Betaproteobacteria bacterium]
MNESRRLWIQALAASGSGLAAHGAVAQSEPMAGRDFRAVNPAQPVEAPAGRIEVLEFFAYWCPHCHSLEPELAQWRTRQPAEVVFRREHVSFRETRIQQLHYALVALGKVDELSPRVFHALHVDKVRLETPQKMAEVLGLDPKSFSEVYESFSVRTRARRGTQVAEAYAIDGVPSLAVAGKYLTAPSMAGSNTAALRVVDFLVARERKAGGSKG